MPKYKPFDKFIIRTPLLPYRMAKEDMNLNDAVFQEAIFLASPDMFEGNVSQDPIKQEKFKQSLNKYYWRAATRCTPFGLFAGCSVGSITEETKIDLDCKTHFKRITRLDMQYLCALIQHIEALPEVRRQLTYYPNDSLYKIGGKYRYIEYHYQKTQRKHNIVSLEIDDALESILQQAKGGSTFSALAESLINDQITIEEAENYLHEVIDSQILKSELDPCVVGGDILTTLLEKIKRLENFPYLTSLQEIFQILQKIDTNPVGTTLSLYSDIIDIIRKIGVSYDAKYLFQTDLFKPVKTAQISHKTANRLVELINFLRKISIPFPNQQITDFARAFQERYEEQEIPLAEALDRELGIGYPYFSESTGDVNPLVNDLVLPNSVSHIQKIQLTPVDKILLKKFIKSVQQSKSSIDLTDEDFKDLSFTNLLPDTIDVLFSVIDQEQLYVRSIGGSSGANLLGRFCHIDRGILNLVKEVARFEQSNNADSILAEISHLPEARTGNVTSRPNFRDYTFHYLSNCEHFETDISVSDLMLSVRSGKVYLRSKKYNKEVKPHLTCAHNYSLSPIPVYRFLCDLQYEGVTGALPCQWNNLFSVFDHLPRIEYKKIILSRELWRLHSEDVDGFVKLSDSNLHESFRKLCAAKGIPTCVVVPDSDNELFLNLEDTTSQRILVSLINKRKTVQLEEFLFDASNMIVHEDGKSFTNEIIMIFHS